MSKKKKIEEEKPSDYCEANDKYIPVHVDKYACKHGGKRHPLGRDHRAKGSHF